MSTSIASHTETIRINESLIRSFRERQASHHDRCASLAKQINNLSDELHEQKLYFAELPAKIAQCERTIDASRKSILREQTEPKVNQLIKLQARIAALTAGMNDDERAAFASAMAQLESASSVPVSENAATEK